MNRDYNTVTPLCSDNILDEVRLRATLDSRYRTELLPIVITVAYNKRTYYIPTGFKVTAEMFEKVKNARGGAGEAIAIRRETRELYDRISVKTRELLGEGRFSFDILKAELSAVGTGSSSAKTLQEFWREFAGSKEKKKTREMYVSAMRSFYRFLGCKVTFTDTDDELHTKTGVFAIAGRKSAILPKEVNEDLLSSWAKSITASGNSISTQAVYLRAMRAVLYQIRDTDSKALKTAPRITIKAGSRRKEDYLKVTDIERIRDHKSDSTDSQTAADFWIMLYLCNGCNMKDFIQLRWSDSYFKNNELSFVRSKTEGKAPVTVYIPVTDFLKPYLAKYASKPEQGKPVFPQLLGTATTDIQLTNTAHRWNAVIRDGMVKVCEELGIKQEKQITASTARNSYITTLTWNCVPDSFIDSMVGHSDGGKVLRGYQGTISPRMRAKYNNLLFTNPEGEED